jgi:hypothetical protein
MGDQEIKNFLFGKSLLDGKQFWLKKEEKNFSGDICYRFTCYLLISRRRMLGFSVNILVFISM